MVPQGSGRVPKQGQTWKEFRPCWRRCSSAHQIAEKFISLARLELVWSCWASSWPRSKCRQQSRLERSVARQWEFLCQCDQEDFKACRPGRGSGFHVERAAERLFPGQVSRTKSSHVLGQSLCRFHQMSSYPLPQILAHAMSLQLPLLRKLNIVLTLKEKKGFSFLLQSTY